MYSTVCTKKNMYGYMYAHAHLTGSLNLFSMHFETLLCLSISGIPVPRVEKKKQRNKYIYTYRPPAVCVLYFQTAKKESK